MPSLLRRGLLALAVALLAACPVWAADFVVPEQSIVTGDPVEFGELVDIKLTPIKERPAGLLGTSYAWKVIDLSTGLEKRFKESGDSIFFGSGTQKKTLKVVCAATYLYEAREAGKPKEVATRTVLLLADVYIGDKPSPPNPPNPPNPDPTFPDGKFGLAKFAYDAAKAQVPAGELRAKAASAMATAYQSTAAAIAAGVLKDPKDILARTAADNDAIVKGLHGGVNLPWKPFTNSLEDKLYGLYEAGKLKTAADYADAWRELAEGLARVPK